MALFPVIASAMAMGVKYAAASNMFQLVQNTKSATANVARHPRKLAAPNTADDRSGKFDTLTPRRDHCMEEEIIIKVQRSIPQHPRLTYSRYEKKPGQQHNQAERERHNRWRRRLLFALHDVMDLGQRLEVLETLTLRGQGIL